MTEDLIDQMNAEFVEDGVNFRFMRKDESAVFARWFTQQLELLPTLDKHGQPPERKTNRQATTSE